MSRGREKKEVKKGRATNHRHRGERHYDPVLLCFRTGSSVDKAETPSCIQTLDSSTTGKLRLRCHTGVEEGGGS